MAEQVLQKFEVVGNEQRLDVFLTKRLNLSRRAVWRLLESDLVELDGRTLSLKAKGEKLGVGSSLTVKPFAHLDKILPQPDLALPILQVGKGFVVVDKPAGMPVRPKTSEEGGTVLNALVAQYPKLQGVGEGGLKSGVVHRLDTDTSGVLVVATHEDVWLELRAAFSEHRTEKRYLAIVKGVPEAEGRLELPLKVTQHSPAKVSVVKDGRNCTLSWKRTEIFRNASLIEVKLETGFLHQIRVMFAHLGHPVLGDEVYGDVSELAKRQMLHASSLKAIDINVRSEPPQDFLAMLTLFR